MSKPPLTLDRASVADALADYLRRINDAGYRPYGRAVIAVDKADRTARLGEAGTPVRHVATYFIEGELFPEPGMTRLGAGESVREGTERLLSGIWEDFTVWNAYDFTRSTSGMNR